MSVEQENLTKQKYLKNGGTIFFISLMAAFVPLSTDLYLPALNDMCDIFNASYSLVNMTLTMFFFFYAVGIVLWGPLSDKYGRKKILIIGNIIYLIASIVCALAPNVYVLLTARIFHGLGAGAITSVSLALVKDCYSGRMRETILSIVQTMSGVAPMVAPVLGAILLKFFNWEASFVVLAVISALNLLLAILYQETLSPAEAIKGSIFNSFVRLFKVCQNGKFMLLVFLFGIFNFAFMGYIATSSYIYQDFFGLSKTHYSYFFAANAAISMIAPMFYVKFMLGMNKKLLATVCLSIFVVSGVLMLSFGSLSPWLFLFTLIPYSAIGSIIRPFSSNLQLLQQEGDTGSASSMINVIPTIFGCIGMTVIPMGANLVTTLALSITVTSAIQLISWLILLKSKIQINGL